MLNQFKLEAYVKDGESMRVERVLYPDTLEEFYRGYVSLTSEKDENGNKKFVSTRPYMAIYKEITNPTEFFKMLKA